MNSFLVNSDKRAAQDNKSRITLQRKGKFKLGRSGVFGRQGIYGQNDSFRVPAVKEFVDKFKHFLKHFAISY